MKAAAIGAAPTWAPGRVLQLVSGVKMGQGDSSGHGHGGAVNGLLPSTGATRGCFRMYTEKSQRASEI